MKSDRSMPAFSNSSFTCFFFCKIKIKESSTDVKLSQRSLHSLTSNPKIYCPLSVEKNSSSDFSFVNFSISIPSSVPTLKNLHTVS